MKLIPALALAGISAAGLGGWYKFHHLKPKTLREYLEWQGFRLLSDSEENYWKAVIEENRKLVSDLNLGGDTKSLRDWCNRSLELGDYDELITTTSLLCTDKPKTVKARIIQLYGNADGLISQDNDYKVAYVFRKHIDGFHSLIGYSPKIGEDGKEVEDLDASKEAFKNWCRDSLKKPVDDALARNIKVLCTSKGFSKIEELIKRNGEEKLLLTNNDKSSQLEKKYSAIKDLDSWTADEPSDKKGTKEGLSNWCSSNKDKHFYEEKVFSVIYPKFRFRCLDLSEKS